MSQTYTKGKILRS